MNNTQQIGNNKITLVDEEESYSSSKKTNKNQELVVEKLF